MRTRLGLAFLIAIASCLAFTASASACPTSHLVLSPKTVGPGDTVSYSISGIDPNATYSFTIAGLTVSGTNDNSPGDSGTFTMPDLGSQEQTLTAQGECTCPGDVTPTPLSDYLTYVPPAPAQPPATTSAPSASPQPAAHRSNARSHRPNRADSPVAIAKHAAKPQRDDAPALATPTGAPPADSVGSEPNLGQPSSGSGKATHSTSESSGVPHRVLHALTSTTSVGPADVPTIGLLLIALIVIAGAALAAFVIYLMRRGPDPEAAIKAPAPIDPDPVEAELQEMIADEMARQLLSDLNLGDPMVTRR
jgi:hypothetical protein